MRLLRPIVFFSVTVLCLLLAGCSSPQGRIDFSATQDEAASTTPETAEAKPLRIAFASVMSPLETRQAYQTMIDYIAVKSGRPTKLLQRRTYGELNRFLADGDADIAFVSTGAYAAYRGGRPIEILAMVQTKGTIFYETYVIAAKDGQVRSFEDTRQRVFAFTDPISYSGRLAVDYRLLDEQTTADAYFHHYFYTYNHDKSIWAVANHLADAASVDSQIYEHMLEENPQLREKVTIIATLSKAPTGPVVIRSDLPAAEKAALRQLFYALGSEASLRPALRQAIIDQFIPPQPELYEPLRRNYLRTQREPGE